MIYAALLPSQASNEGQTITYQKNPYSSSKLLGQLCKSIHMAVHGFYCCFTLNREVLISTQDLLVKFDCVELS